MSGATAAGPAVRTEDVGAVRVVTMDRPARRNALDLDDRRELLAALAAVESDESVRALVLTGAGPVFSAGGDIASMSPDREVANVRLGLVNDLARRLVRGRVPVVAAVEGGAHGLGLALACACDVVVSGAGARYAASFVKIGLTADTGLLHTLPRRVGPGRARALLLTARTLDAAEALGAGLVDEVVTDGEALQRSVEVATGLAAYSRDALAATRAVLDAGHRDLDDVLEAEKQAQVRLLAGSAFAEGQAAFLERRRPDFPTHGG
ncbi:enoyl-CoA hydratase/isomerase family protein [uncultured Nocardioides sp.]|uniref:enoyl-CoA hydratase/isomerase family protein n=1 Tax=uncultured Nocardioides sp. TaxID=198441 RepID=UPI002603B7DD|nr:enoyl-CoA hydratase/isomerase family protein [uncultured Nocardioides sp.]